MSRTLLSALFISFGLLRPAYAQQWKDYQPQGEGYRVEFPGTPTEDTRRTSTNAGVIESHTSALSIGNQTFITVRSDYPSTMTMGDPEANLDRAGAGSIQRANGTLRREERLTVGNAPARHLLIDIPGSNQIADTLLVMQDHRLIQAVYVGPATVQEAPDARRFLSSFALVR